MTEYIANAEQATRYLRSKTKDCLPLVSYANDLLDDKFPDLFFPRKEDFLLEWWFDRKDIGKGKAQFWELFPRIWDSLDPSLRLSLYRKNRFPDLLHASLAEVKTLSEHNLSEGFKLLQSVLNATFSIYKSELWLRCSLELMVRLVTTYFSLVLKYDDKLWTEAHKLILSVYSSTLYGISSYKKVSELFGNDGLLLCFQLLDHTKNVDLKTSLGDIIRDIAFSPSVLKDQEKSNELFKSLFKVLSNVDNVHEKSEFQSHVLGLGLSKLEKTRQKYLMPQLCQAFLTFSNVSSTYVISEAQKYNVTIPTDSLKEALSIQGHENWPLATLILENDADTILPQTEEYFLTLSKLPISDNLLQFCSVLINTHAKVRSLQEFIVLWRKFLRNANEDSILLSESIVQRVAHEIIQSWSIHKVCSVLYELYPIVDQDIDLVESDLLPLLSITISLSNFSDSFTTSLIPYYQTVYLFLDKLSFKDLYLSSRLKYLILSLHSDLVKSYIKDKYSDDSDAKAVIKELKKDKDRDPRVTYFKIQILFRLSEFKPIYRFSEVVDYFLQIFSSSSKLRLWNGKIDGIDKKTLRTALASSTIDRWLVLVEHRFNDDQKNTLVSVFGKFFEANQQIFDLIWIKYVNSTILQEQVKIKDLTSSLILSKLSIISQFSEKYSSDQEAIIERIIDSISFFPIECLRRSIRERILDHLLELDSKLSSLILITKSRSLMRDLMIVPNMTAKVQVNPNGVQKLVERLDTLEYAAFQDVTVELLSRVFSHASSGDIQEDRLQFLFTLNTEAYNSIQKNIGKKEILVGSFQLFTYSSKYLWQHREKAHFNLKQRVEIVRNYLIESITSSTDNSFILRDLSYMDALQIQYDILHESTEEIPSNILGLIPRYMKVIASSDSDESTKNYALHIAGKLFELYLFSMSPEKVTTETAALIISFFAALSQAVDHRQQKSSVFLKVSQSLKKSASRWEKDVFCATVDQIIGFTFPVSTDDDAKYIDALSWLLVSGNQNNNAFLAEKILLLASVSVIEVDKIRSPASLISLLKLLERFLREQHTSVEHFTFEQILIFLIRACSQHGPKFSLNESEHSADEVYLQICSVTSVLLLSYHKYFRGYHNLIVRLLQNLLYGLCRPQLIGTAKKIDRRAKHLWKRASWLSDDSASCSVKCALAYSRLISNLCEPNQTSRSKNSTVSNTRKRGIDQASTFSSESQLMNLSSRSGNSRRALSKHIPFLVIEYIYSTLYFRYDSDVRQAIMSGLYTLLDMHGQNELKVINAGLDSAGREIFRTIYSDYSKFGKWHED
ncbi:Urb2/Npa2 family-domain-containing protein [Lipomyces japonicus]|uniref:Urb2/Npa2 family-domain-containing protein n=1 Tax=Lipomyces japonicus TaxID=56871 RepID=UPI0034CE349E